MQVSGSTLETLEIYADQNGFPDWASVTPTLFPHLLNLDTPELSFPVQGFAMLQTLVMPSITALPASYNSLTSIKVGLSPGTSLLISPDYTVLNRIELVQTRGLCMGSRLQLPIAVRFLKVQQPASATANCHALLIEPSAGITALVLDAVEIIVPTVYTNEFSVNLINISMSSLKLSGNIAPVQVTQLIRNYIVSLEIDSPLKPYTFPSAGFVNTNLKEMIFSGYGWLNMSVPSPWPPSVLQENICNGLPLSLQSLTLPANAITTLPSCLPSFSHLKTLKSGSIPWWSNYTTLDWDVSPEPISASPVGSTPVAPSSALLPSSLESLTLAIIVSAPTYTANIDWDALASKCPNLTSLYFSFSTTDLLRVASTPFPVEAFYNMPKLMSLMVTGDPAAHHFSGTIPEDFFMKMSNLSNVRLMRHALEGTIPWYGLDNLMYLTLQSNRFTNWPPFAAGETWPLPNLSHIDLSDNRLVEIPDDASLQRLVNLSLITLFNNVNLSGPFPDVFGPALKTFIADSTALSGTLPTIRSPLLTSVSISLTNLCGNLPDLLFPSTVAMRWSTPYNQLTGSLPLSWSTKLFHSLDLSHNNLDGNSVGAANPPITPMMLFGGRFLFSYNSFTDAPMFNASDFLGGDFQIESSGILPCLSSPDFGPKGTFSCSIDTPIACYCEPFWDRCSTPPQSNCRRDAKTQKFARSQLQTPVCVQPPPRPGRSVPPSPAPPLTPPAGTSPNPIPQSSCPSPTPTPISLFVCISGVWNFIPSSQNESTPITISTQVISPGNFSASSVTFQGTFSTLIVQGCSVDIKDIILVLSPADIERIEKQTGQKLTQNLIVIEEPPGGCSTSSNLKGIGVSVKNAKKSCKQVKTQLVTKETGNGTTKPKQYLSVVFSVDKSKCNVWWIVLVSVVCGLIILATIGAIIFFAIRPKPTDERAG